MTSAEGLCDINMISQNSTVTQMLLYTLLALVASANAAVPLIPKPVPAAPKPVEVIPNPVPILPKPIAPKAITPSKPQNQNSGNRNGGGRNGNKVGGSRSGTQTLPRLEKLPRSDEEMTIEDDASVFSLGSFRVDDREQALFENFDGPSLPFYSKMYDFFAAEESYLPTENAYAEATGKKNPFPSGYRDRPTGRPITLTGTASLPTEHKVTATFKPAEATDACKAWSTLRSYCGNAGQDCACYSGTYYVPDQWNSLADACASVTSKCSGMDTDDNTWCRFGKTAYDYNTYCADIPRGEATSVKFAESANLASDTTPTPEPDPEPTPDSSAPTSDDPVITSDEPVATQTIVAGSTPNFVESTLDSPTSFYFSPIQTTSAPAGSWSPHSLDPVIASMFAWMSLLAAMIVL